MKTHNIWAHGYCCDCEQCKTADNDDDFVVFDSRGRELDQFALPTLEGPGIALKDQYGRTYFIMRMS